MKRQAGFSLIELLVSLGIVVIFFLAMLTMFERGARINKVEGSVSDSQQNVRYGAFEMVKQLRMARVGGVSFTRGVVPLINNAGTGVLMTDLNGTIHPVRPGTDALNVRGVITAPLFTIDPTGYRPDPSGTGFQVAVNTKTPSGYYNNPVANSCYTRDQSGTCQPGPNNFDAFFNALHAFDSNFDADTGAGAPGAHVVPIVVSDSLGNYDVGTLLSTSLSPPGPPSLAQQLLLQVNFTTNAMSYNKLAGTFQNLNNPARAGLLDDMVYFVHDGAEGSETAGSPIDPTKQHPFLASAHRYILAAGAIGNGLIDSQVMVENIEDMQIAYGVDAYSGPPPVPGPPVIGASGPDGAVYPQESTTVAGVVQVDGDEWIPNVAGDTITVQTFLYHDTDFSPASIGTMPAGMFQYTPAGAAGPVPLLRAIKIALVAVGDQPDTADGGYRGPGAKGVSVMDSTAVPIGIIAPGPPPVFQPFHRRVIDLAVNLRNYAS